MSAPEKQGARVVCEKCLGSDILVRWHGKGDTHRSREHARCAEYGDDWGKPAAEHLHYHCRQCQFDWTGPVASPEAVAEARADTVFVGAPAACCEKDG